MSACGNEYLHSLDQNHGFVTHTSLTGAIRPKVLLCRYCTLGCGDMQLIELTAHKGAASDAIVETVRQVASSNTYCNIGTTLY